MVLLVANGAINEASEDICDIADDKKEAPVIPNMGGMGECVNTSLKK